MHFVHDWLKSLSNRLCAAGERSYSLLSFACLHTLDMASAAAPVGKRLRKVVDKAVPHSFLSYADKQSVQNDVIVDLAEIEKIP